MIEYQKILNKNLLNVFIEILKEVEEKGEVSKSQKPQGFVGFAILPDNVSDLINYGSLAGIVALIISLISAVPVIARKRKMGTPNWFESMIDEEIQSRRPFLEPLDMSCMPLTDPKTQHHLFHNAIHDILQIF